MSTKSETKPVVSADGLFAYLDAKGIRQIWLANKLGISQQYLTHIKVGRKPVPAWLPCKAAEALGVPVFLLFPEVPNAAA